MNASKAEKFWDKLATQFDKRIKHFEQPPVEQAKKYLKESDTVLDFGCATGTVTNEIAPCVNEIVGIDISSKMIDAAKRKADEYKIRNVDFKQTTIFDEDFSPETFDTILAFNILHFFEDTPKVLQRISTLLKHEGTVIIATACLRQRTFSNILQLFFFPPMIKMGIIPYMKFFTITEMKSALGKAGFQVIEVENLKSPSNYFITAKKVLGFSTNK
jgi:2-polyprenyl-3-methyl-5-hydroxy-6-metoxy-1,4-benzoquinol methylase